MRRNARGQRAKFDPSPFLAVRVFSGVEQVADTVMFAILDGDEIHPAAKIVEFAFPY